MFAAAPGRRRPHRHGRLHRAPGCGVVAQPSHPRRQSEQRHRLDGRRPGRPRAGRRPGGSDLFRARRGAAPPRRPGQDVDRLRFGPAAAAARGAQILPRRDRARSPGRRRRPRPGAPHDLAGNPRDAQRDYRTALHKGRDDEVTRRLALSLAISGEREPALRLLENQLLVRDRSAERARALVLALTGDTAGATRAVQAAMPGPQAGAMRPFLARLPALSPAERALAVHLGVFPSDARPAAQSTYAANDFANAVTDAGRRTRARDRCPPSHRPTVLDRAAPAPRAEERSPWPTPRTPNPSSHGQSARGRADGVGSVARQHRLRRGQAILVLRAAWFPARRKRLRPGRSPRLKPPPLPSPALRRS